MAVVWPTDLVPCASCAGDECDHGLRTCPACGPVDCRRCKGTGEVEASQHPDWCSDCGMQGDCPACKGV